MAWGAFLKFGLQVVGSFLLSSLLAPNVRQTGSRLEDKSVQTSTYGIGIPRIHGTMAVHGNVIWLKDDKLFDISVTAKGKKTSLGGNRSRTTVYPVFATFSVALCEGPIIGVRRIWVGSDLVYDAGSDDLESIIASNSKVAPDPLAELPESIVFKGNIDSVQDRLPPWTFQIFKGTETEEPSIAMEADKGVGNVPAYRGIARIEIYNLPLEKYGNSLQGAQVKAEVITAATLSNHAIQSVVIPRASVDFPGSMTHVDETMVYTVQRPQWDSSYWSPGTIEISKYYISGYRQDDLDVINNQLTPLHATSDRSEFMVTADLGETVISGDALWRISGVGGLTLCEREGDYLYVLRNFNPILIKKCITTVGRLDAPNSSVMHESPTLTNPDAHVARDRKNFCVGTDHVYLLGDTLIYAYHKADMSLDYTVAYARPHTVHACIFREGLIRVWFRIDQTQGMLSSINPATGVFVHSDVVSYTLTMPSIPENATMDFRNNTFILGYTRPSSTTQPGCHVQVFQIGRVTSDGVPLMNIVSQEVQRSKILTNSDIIASSLTDLVRGYRITDVDTIRSAIEPLQAVWPFDVYQSGYKLKFIRRGNVAVVSIPADKLDARAYGAAPGTELTIEREMDAQLPRFVSLKYLDVNREYDIGEQSAERKTTESISKSTLEISVSLTAAEAAQATEVMLWMAWRDRHDVTFSLPPEYLQLEPTDVIEVTGQWGTYNLRLTKVDYKTDGRLECMAKFESAASYVSAALGVESESTGQQLLLSGASFYELMDIPCLSDQFNIPGIMAAMGGHTRGWPGGVLYRSTDAGATWDDLLLFPYRVIMGYAVNALTAGELGYIDPAQQLEVKFIVTKPTTVTLDQLLAYGNYFAYGKPGRWEIIGAQLVADTADETSLMSNLLRGRFGTEWAMGLHQADDTVVMLSDNNIQWINYTDVDLTYDYIGVTAEADFSGDDAEPFTYTGVNFKPLSSVHDWYYRNLSTNSWQGAWIARGRISIEWQDAIDVPVGEDTQAYQVDIFTNNTFTTVARTIAVTTPTFLYSSADQVTDFGSNQTALYYEVYKMSATVGRGYPLRVSAV